MINFERGSVYKRRSLHEQFGGQPQGGISTPRNHNFIMLFTGDSGEKFGYHDGWDNDGIFFYTGEGRRGNMQFSRGNKAIRDHISNGKTLFLFQILSKGNVRFLDEFQCIGYHYEDRPDEDNNLRQAIIFELASQSSLSFQIQENTPTYEEHDSLENLRKKAQDKGRPNLSPRENKSLTYQRSIYIRKYALKRAEGKCEACNESAPFLTPLGNPFLEVHHIRKLSDGGPEDPLWVIAVCPNCHRKAHYSIEANSFNESLNLIVLEKETSLGFL
jgi:5-methylcytosine-specific restriction protein A